MVPTLARRLPFYYGWVVIAVAFVTMAVGVNARTSFSILLPPILDEFGWDRGVTAGAFSFGFLTSAFAGPSLGALMDGKGPRFVIGWGVCVIAAGMALASRVDSIPALYLTLGLLVGGGSVCLTYTGQSLYLPNWFVRRRGLAMSLAFSGVGVGSILLFPLMQRWIEAQGWRSACLAFAILLVVVLLPLNLLLARRPQDLGLSPDGDAAIPAGGVARKSNIVDAQWAATDWTLRRALRTTRFWALCVAYSSGLFVWYAVQVHQTKFLVDTGYDRAAAAWALGAVSLAGVPGQIAFGWLSDRIGREWVWTAGALGFAATYLCLLAMNHGPDPFLFWGVVLFQGVFGYSITSVFGAVPAEIFEGRQYGRIFGALSLTALLGGALGPWCLGLLFDWTGDYNFGFSLCVALSLVCAGAIWVASPGKVRAVAGRLPA